MSSEIWITTKVIGYHAWTHAPEEVKFLRSVHRHVFHIKVGIVVDHPDRMYEFFNEQRRLHSYMDAEFNITSSDEVRFGQRSCEQIATDILKLDPLYSYVEVSEDGENGAIVRRRTP